MMSMSLCLGSTPINLIGIQDTASPGDTHNIRHKILPLNQLSITFGDPCKVSIDCIMVGLVPLGS